MFIVQNLMLKKIRDIL